MNRVCLLAAVLAALAAVAPVVAPAEEHMSMPMADAPANFKPTVSAYTADRAFLVKLIGLPEPIPYQKYFPLRFAVYDGHDTGKQLSDASLALFAGMRHGMTEGFAHGMQSTPKIERRNGLITIDGMYFHMMGRWTLKVTVSQGGRQDVAYFDLPCCGK